MLQRWSAPEAARRARPGQFVHVLEPRHVGLLLPVLPLAGVDPVAGTVELLLDPRRPDLRQLRRLRPGESARLSRPLGTGFEVDARSRFLLAVVDDDGLAPVRSLAFAMVRSGRQLTVLLGAGSVAAVPPSTLLPDEVEYMVATDDGSLGHHGAVTELVPAYEAWADQCFAAGSHRLLQAMATLATGRDARMGVARLGRRGGRRGGPRAAAAPRRRAWLQVALRHVIGCELGVCLGCVTAGADGPRRVCREGPVFAADALRWDPPR